ncbi:hypothetical protein F5876DRAFT_74082 [Lentinula aff. lateritia]|uniref:Uncharacterized protein n=1 Tax=Lentinula aff. lateritia TaxID=2804960 RepID=A0ACC1U867_9AGAR|nr:hypothetical protein F5876DRAFT_74082 [Lentinula aff. lateritia]
MPTVWFMVDDTDPRLKYSGSWTAVNNTGSFTNEPGSDFDEQSKTGSVYNDTLHYTTGNVTISFRFDGSSYLGVYGTQDGTVFNGQLPFINCTLDGVPTWSFNDAYPKGLANNNMLACRADSRIGGSSPGEHELLINVTNYPNSNWYFDYITYESLNNPAFNGEVLQAGNAELIDVSNYSMITFDAGWTGTSNDTTATNIPGSKAILKFNGTSLSLYGDTSGNVSNTASYQVDNEEPVGFQLPAVPPGSTSLAKQLLFTTSNLSVEEHTVSVVFNGSQSAMPLEIAYFYATSLISPSPRPILVQSAASPLNHGVIAGVIIGSIVVALLLISTAASIFRRRRRNMQLAGMPFGYPGLIATPFQYQDDINIPVHSKSSTDTPPNLQSFYTTTLDPSGEQGTAQTGGDPANGLANLKLQQRLAVLQGEIAHRDRLLAEGSVQQERAFTVHIDSGLRQIGEEEVNLGMVEVPPGYTVD